MTRLASIISACFALGVSAAATAGDIGKSPVLHVDQGSVMASDGGEFAPASTGKALKANDRLMVAEGSTATVVYDNGCTTVYTKPGVYVIAPTCIPAAAAVASGSAPASAAGALLNAAPVIATAVAGAAVLENQPDSEAPPISR